ncbi:MAG: hypothetical protein IPL88_15700 [Rhizobiales bacterium]|nr:hypothetical protein [Hyphomicrobiales bacterium]
MRQALPRIEDLSAAEEKRAALSYVNEAFAEAILSGVEADCFAQAAIFTALQELVETYGEEAVAHFAERLPERIRCGEFSVGLRQ